MESFMQNLTALSKSLDLEILAQYRRCTSDQEIEQRLSQELTQLTNMNLAATDAARLENWLQRVFMSLRLHYVAQVGENALEQQAQAEAYPPQAAQRDVLDILAETDDWTRTRTLGTGTYEMMVLRLRALATMGCTLTTPSTNYVTQFCTEYNRFQGMTAAIYNEPHWKELLGSLQQSLKTSPLIKKVVAPVAHQSRRRNRTTPPNPRYAPVYSSWRERVVTFSSVFGLVFVCLAIIFVSPAWILTQVRQTNKVQAARRPSASPAALASIQPTATPASLATSTPVTTQPSAIPSTPIPAPTAAPAEQAGFFVIGMAAREEASAQAEAQKQRAAGLNPRVVYSSNWSGLTPNYYQVVYGIFANRSETTALRQDLEKRGIKTYVMHSGQRVHP